MKIYYSLSDFIDITISDTNIHIQDSYKVKKASQMKYVLALLKQNYPSNEVLKRSELSLLNEWRVHNLCYTLGIFKSHTKDVDLNLISNFSNFLYSLLSPFYPYYK